MSCPFIHKEDGIRQESGLHFGSTSESPFSVSINAATFIIVSISLSRFHDQGDAGLRQL